MKARAKTVRREPRDPLTPLRNALQRHTGPEKYFALPENRAVLAFHLDAALRSAIRAVLPGRQQKKNLDPVMKKALPAFVRRLRDRAPIR